MQFFVNLMFSIGALTALAAMALELQEWQFNANYLSKM